jgi:hypothetical protein
MPAAASAARPATPAELSQLALVTHRSVACTNATVSEAPGQQGLWARVEENVGPAECSVFDGFTAVTNVGAQPGAWTDRFVAGLDNVPICEAAGVPRAVGLDLRICNPRFGRTYVPGSERFEYRPKSLLTGGNIHVDYRRVRWSRWTRTRAVGRGILFYDSETDHYRVPVRFRLSRVRRCRDGERMFTRQTTTAVRARDRKWVRDEVGTNRTLRCPARDDAFDPEALDGSK